MENIIQNEELMEKFTTVETVEELNKVLAEHNIVLEEGVTAEQFLETLKGGESDELGEDDLQSVSGGIVITPAIIAGAIAVGMSLAKYIAYLKRRKRW